jgi:uncharacterized protein YbjT (DUF2867 family)
MDPILITGAAGTLGSAVHRTISARGVACRGLSRTTRAAPGLSYVAGDLLTGAGIEEAVRGTATIIHCATNPESPDEDVMAADRLIEAARRHDTRIVFVSVAGIEKAAKHYPYYRCKRDIEARLRNSGLAYAIARATQFHPLIAYMMIRLEIGPLMIVPARTKFQLVSPEAFAARLAEAAIGGAAGDLEDTHGPEMLGIEEIARIWLRAQQRRKPVLSLPIPFQPFRALRELTPVSGRGVGETWCEWVEAHIGIENPYASPTRSRGSKSAA